MSIRDQLIAVLEPLVEIEPDSADGWKLDIAEQYLGGCLVDDLRERPHTVETVVDIILNGDDMNYEPFEEDEINGIIKELGNERI